VLAAGVLLIAALALGGFGMAAKFESGKSGVVVVPEVFGRKGPSYRYQTAFNEALHDGLELEIVEQRDAWLQVELSDERRSWVPESQVQRVFR
jgi:SH3-like domain-containing protein